MNAIRSRQQTINEQAFALGATLVEEFSPEETEFYGELIAAHQDPTKMKKDHPLGIGLGPLVDAVSPYFYEVGGALVGGLWAVAQGTTEKSIEDVVAPKITDWIRRKFAKPAPLALT